jgi:hypothetical protein
MGLTSIPHVSLETGVIYDLPGDPQGICGVKGVSIPLGGTLPDWPPSVSGRSYISFEPAGDDTEETVPVGDDHDKFLGSSRDAMPCPFLFEVGDGTAVVRSPRTAEDMSTRVYALLGV